MSFSFFQRDPANPDVLVPQSLAQSLWSETQMHGVAISGAIALGLEEAALGTGRSDLQAARLTVDLFSAARMEPSLVRTRVVREGKRLLLIDGELVQGLGEGEEEKVVARSSALFLLPTETPDGLVWSAEDVPQVPPVDVVPVSDQPRVPFLASANGWSQNFGEHANAGRHAIWQSVPPVLPGVADGGVAQSGFVSAAAVADSTSMVVNWGSKGVEYINTDITVTLSRPIQGTEMGLTARDRFESAGVAVGSAVLIDRSGPVGITMVTAMANARRTVTFEGAEYQDAPA